MILVKVIKSNFFSTLEVNNIWVLFQENDSYSNNSKLDGAFTFPVPTLTP